MKDHYAECSKVYDDLLIEEELNRQEENNEKENK
tara:strand:- start:1108 stop:1209 length:102 start_codon:yes stop_codon:yes gene_type:complete